MCKDPCGGIWSPLGKFPGGLHLGHFSLPMVGRAERTGFNSSVSIGLPLLGCLESQNKSSEKFMGMGNHMP